MYNALHAAEKSPHTADFEVTSFGFNCSSKSLEKGIDITFWAARAEGDQVPVLELNVSTLRFQLGHGTSGVVGAGTGGVETGLQDADRHGARAVSKLGFRAARRLQVRGELILPSSCGHGIDGVVGSLVVLEPIILLVECSSQIRDLLSRDLLCFQLLLQRFELAPALAQLYRRCSKRRV